MSDEIDWAKLRARIGETPIVSKPTYIKLLGRSPESLERRRASSRARSKKHYWAHREEHLQLQREWEMANPEKVKAKRKRFYEAHKDDPKFKERRSSQQKKYRERKKAERLALLASSTDAS